MDTTCMMAEENRVSGNPGPKRQFIPRTRWVPVTESLPEDTLPEDSDRLVIACLTARAGADNSVTKLMRQRYRKHDGTFSPWYWSRAGWNKEPTHWCLCPKAPEKGRDEA